MRKRVCVMEFLTFFTQFAKYPGMVGSVVPSSKYLTRRMLAPVNWDEAGVIIELGCGTGVFTQEIIRLHKQQSQIMLFERNGHFRSLLMKKYPALPIYKEAQALAFMLQSQNKKADVIISSLPFSNFPDKKQDAILQVVYDSLADQGLFITYQYSLQMKQKLEQCFSKISVSKEWLNIPPAWVYTCKKEEGKVTIH